MKFFWYHFLSLLFFSAVVFVRSDDSSPAYCLTNEEAKEFNDRLVDIHNKYRALHGAPKLEADEKLMEDSIEWSKGLVAKGEMEHSDSQDQYGENLYQANSNNNDNAIDALKLDPVEPWYKENELYKPGDEFSEQTGHYTQVVWKSSEKVGCGVCNGSTGIFVTCRYTPPGNVEGKFEENVLPLKSNPNENGTNTSSDPDESGTTTTLDGDFGFNITEILLLVTSLILFLFTLIAVICMFVYGVYAVANYYKTNNPDHDHDV